MVSLTTVYVVYIILTSIAGISSAFASNKIGGGTTSQIVQPTVEEQLSNTEQIQPEVPLGPA